MKLKTNPLSDALRYCLALSAAGVATLASAPVLAQDDVDEMATVEVVGSRIKRVDAETTQPVLVISREEIQQTGLNNVYDLLNNISAADGTGLSTVTTQTNGSNGSEQISLRGLGASRTLVLVDGKRWATDTDATVDLSTIPLAIIERIEVLKDGASAIYGSDAVAGVINIVTRRDFVGAQAYAYYGETSDGDGERSAFEATIGAAGERSSVVMAVSRTEQKAIFAGDREISAFPYLGCEQLAQRPGYDTPGNLDASLGAFCGSAAGAYGNFTAPGAFTGARALTPGLSGRNASDFNPFTNNDRYNFSPVNYLQQPSTRKNVFVSGRFDVTDTISAYARVNYNKRTSDQRLAEVPLTIAISGASGPQWAIPVSAAGVFNPFGVDVTVANHRSVAVGPRNPSYDFDTLASVGGLEGSFEIGDRTLYWELYGQYNDGQFDRQGTGYINLFNLRNALGPSFRDASGTLRCGTPTAIIRNCVPYNIFGGPDLGVGQGVITAAEQQAMINYVSYVQVGTAGSTQRNWGGTISGDVFELPGGALGFALGFETRRDDVFNQPDTLVASGGSSDNFSEPTLGSTKVEEVFLEVVAPLVRDVAFAKELEISVAVRKSDYEATGRVGANFSSNDPGSPTNEKYSLRWKPIDELMVRASFGETFRAPSALDLYQGGTESFPQAQDPCNTTQFPNLAADAQARCRAAGVPAGGAPQLNAQLRSLGGGNPLLSPEVGENYSYGLVWSPGFLEGFDLTVDYWHIELEDALATRGAAATLNACYRTGDPQACTFIERAADGAVSVVRTGQINLNSLEASGVDLGMSYRYETENYGSFRWKWDTTWNEQDRVNGFDTIGSYNGEPHWEWRSSLTTNWALGDWDASWTMRYSSDLEEAGQFIAQYVESGFNPDVLDLPNSVGSVVYHDLQIGWSAPWDAKIAVGARNLFGKEPPVVSNAFAHSFDAAYDLPGGAYYYLS